MSPGRRLGIVTGLPAEARAAPGGGDIRVLRCGARPGRAGIHARSLVEWGAAGLVSFGVAGGLRPGLAAGTIVIASEIVAPGGGLSRLDAAWADRLAGALPPALPVLRGTIAGAVEPVADAAAKAALARSSGAVAVDMESHAVALAGERAGLPVLALRAVADPAGRGLPASAIAAFPVDGAHRVLAELCRRPRDLPALAALALDYRRALAALRRVVAAAGPGLGFPG